jgi:hypothetical protein
MTVLTDSKSIREAIRKLLADPNDERIVAVAYVGADALRFLPTASGITLYCWPQAGGTNPIGVEKLLDAGVQVHFVKRLHAKVYWSRANGALIGSANLTANALGDRTLQEAAVVVPPGHFDMASFCQAMKVERNFAARLSRLHEEHVRFLQRNPPKQPRTSRTTDGPNFLRWLAREGRADWRLGWYEEDESPPSDSLDEFERARGTRKFATCLGARRSDDLRAGLFTLSFRIRESGGKCKITRYEWWVPELVARTRDKAWQDWPCIWFANVRIPDGARPPFNVADKRFRRAFAHSIQQYGGLDWLKKAPLAPTAAFLDQVRGNYEAAASYWVQPGERSFWAVQQGLFDL